MYRLFLSFRFLVHHWLMTLIGSFFVGASLVILVVVMAVMDGFQAKLRETVAGSSADLILTPRYPVDLAALERELKDAAPQVEATGPFLQTVTMARRAGRLDPFEQKLHFAVVFGIDGRKEQRINRFREYLHRRGGRDAKESVPTVRDLDDPFKVHDVLAEASGTPGVIVGEGLRRELRVELGQRIRLATIEAPPGGENGDADPADVRFEYRQALVVGFYASGNSEVDKHCIFMDHERFKGFFKGDVAKVSVRARLTDPDDFGAVHMRVKAALGTGLVERTKLPGVTLAEWQKQLQVDSWQHENAALVRAIESEKAMILIIAFLIVVAGTSSIFAAQWLLVSDKVREIGILRALGARFGGVTSIFVANGFLMGLLGSAGGTLVGLLVVDQIDAVHAFLATVTGRELFDADIYLFDRIPTRVDYAQVTQYALAALGCTLVASAIPAIRAGVMDPAKALHRD